MNCRTTVRMNCMILAFVLLIGSVVCFPTPSTARVINHDMMSIQIGQQEKEPVVTSDLLAENGKIIFVNGDFEEMTIPVSVVFAQEEISQTTANELGEGDLVSETESTVETVSESSTETAEDGSEEETKKAIVTAASSNEKLLQVSVDAEEIIPRAEGNTIRLSLKVLAEEKTETETKPDPGSGEGTASGSTDKVESETTGKTEGDTTGSETESGTTGSGTEGGTTGSGTESDTSGSETEGETTGSGTESDTSGSETEGDTTGSGTESDTTGSETESGTTESGTEGEDTNTLEEDVAISGDGEENTGTVEDPADAVVVPMALRLLRTAPVSESTESNQTESATEAVTENKSETTTAVEEEILSAEITFTYGEQALSATIVIMDTDEETDTEQRREPSFCPSQYHPMQPFRIINDQEEDCVLGEFPAMSQYRLEEETYLLYAGGNIRIPAEQEVLVDLSLTELVEEEKNLEEAESKDLMLTSGGGTEYLLKYTAMEQIPKESYPLIAGGDGLSLPVSYSWGAIVPSVKLEQLVTKSGLEDSAEGEEVTDDEIDEEDDIIDEEEDQDGLVWKVTEVELIKADETGKLQIVPDRTAEGKGRAAAGTYRATISWIEDEITLYEMEIPFFVQYKNGDGGVHSNDQ